jgi:hypothetical protein
LAFLITEILRNSETSKSYTGTGTWGLVHLSEDESNLGIAFEIDDTSFDHFMVQVVTLTRAFTDT